MSIAKRNRPNSGDDKYVVGKYNLHESQIDAMVKYKGDVETLTADKTLTASDCNRKYILNAAAGLTITLPAISSLGVGVYVDIEVMTTVTSNDYGIDTGSTDDLFEGRAFLSKAADYVAGMTSFAADESNDDSLNMNGTTTGGLIGSKVRLTVNENDMWTVDGILLGSGTLATPFA